jgi:hypothetical protein
VTGRENMMSLSQQIENLTRSLNELPEGAQPKLRAKLERDLFRLKCLKEECEGQPQMSEQERADRQLVGNYCHFNGAKRASLPESVRNTLDRAVWKLQDGYGEAGYTPVQGWDWSGIRDSSPQAFRNMAVVVEAILEAHGLRS